MNFVNLTGWDITLRFKVAAGVTDEKVIPAASCQMQVAEGQVVGNCNDIELWMMEEHKLRLQFPNGNNCDAFDGGYQWNPGVMYIVSHEVLIALKGAKSDLHFAAPIGPVQNRPDTFTGLQVLFPNGKLSKNLSPWPA